MNSQPMTKPLTLKEYYAREDRLDSLKVTAAFLRSNIQTHKTNPAMVAEFEQKLAETEKEISKLIAEI